MDWIGLSVGAATWATFASGVGIYLHSRSSDERKRFREHVDMQIAALASQTKKDHDSTRVQINDLTTTVSQHYVPRREFESGVHGLGEQITEARKEIGAVSNQITDVHKRVDSLYQSVEWRHRS